MYALSSSLVTCHTQPGMTPYIMMLFNTVRMIHSISKYYNTSDKLSALLIKVGEHNCVLTCDFMSTFVFLVHVNK